MNNSVLKTSRQNDDSKATPALQKKGKAVIFTDLFVKGKDLLDSFQTWALKCFNPQKEWKSSKPESISNEDKVAILKTQCDYVRSCYRVKILERQQALDNVPKNLDTEIDELLDSYQRLKRAYEKLESNER